MTKYVYLFKEGNKIKLDELRIDNTLKDNINRIYQNGQKNNELNNEYICPYCKNIINIPKQ